MNSANTTISVIIPVYQTAAYLEECANSLLAQTYTDWEAWLVDDGSTDGSAALCDRLAREDARFHVIHTVNGGVSRARNLGLEVAGGAHIVFLDSDDKVAPTYLARLWEMKQQNPAALSMCGLAELDAQKAPGQAASESLLEAEAFMQLALSAREGIWLSACGVLYPGAYQLRFDEQLAYGEDSWFFSQALKKAGQVAFDPAPLYFYRRDRAGNTVTRRSLEKEEDSLQVWQRIETLYAGESDAIQTLLSRIVCDKQLQAARQAGLEGKKEMKRHHQKEAAARLKTLGSKTALGQKDRWRLRLLTAAPVWGPAIWEKLKGKANA